MKVSEKRILWLRWVAANAFGELIGLGDNFRDGGAFYPPGAATRSSSRAARFCWRRSQRRARGYSTGLAQWRAMRRWFQTITQTSWWFATLMGALVAYVLGYLPSTLIEYGSLRATTTPATEPPPATE